MKFARIVFAIAGVYGVLVLAPLYFFYDRIGRQNPPPITHPQFYYGFAGVALAFQFVFFLIATDPARFRPMIAPSIVEKITYAAACATLHSQGRISFSDAAWGLPDTLFCLLFVVAWFTTHTGSRRMWIPNVRIP